MRNLEKHRLDLQNMINLTMWNHNINHNRIIQLVLVECDIQSCKQKNPL